MSKHLHRDLERLKREILQLGALVEEATVAAIVAFVQRRPDLARKVIDGDVEIDRREVELEEECLKLLALHQPVATDLRFIIVVLKVNNDLERMGDLAVNIAERAEALAALPPIGVQENFRPLVEQVRGMVRNCLDALVNRDTALAQRVCLDDDDVDARHARMYQLIQDLIRLSPEALESAIQALSVSRNLERIADLATNIAEDVVFMVEGEVIRHRYSAPPQADRNLRP